MMRSWQCRVRTVVLSLNVPVSVPEQVNLTNTIATCTQRRFDLQATSQAQLAATTSGALASLEQVRDDVWALPLPMPGGHIPFSLCYLVVDEKGAVHVVDPGWDSDENLRIIVASLTQLGKIIGDVVSITVTHLHPDHLGMAKRLRGESGAPVALHRQEQFAIEQLIMESTRARDESFPFAEWGVPEGRRPELESVALEHSRIAAFTADILLDDGERLNIPGRELVVIHTPGHTVGHISLRDAAQHLLFTGDHVLPVIYPGLGLGGSSNSNALRDYLDSLDGVARFDDHEVLPGHEFRFNGLAERCEAIAAHHLRRSRQVADALAGNPDASVWEIASTLTWTAGWGNLRGFYAYSALSQTAMHVDYLRQEH